MIDRVAAENLLKAATMFPVVAVTGPRQSGKTTLCQSVFNDRPYLSFEDPETRERFVSDPKGFLAHYRTGAVFDEAQRCPEIFSYLQGVVDGDRRMGRFILTGSQQFHLASGVTQSLAGRVVTLELLPFSYCELESNNELFSSTADLDRLLFHGFYPPIYDRPVEPRLWYANYVRNYVERDVRSLLNISNLETFQRFVRLCAARTGQLINLSEIGNAAGVNHNTVKSWLSVLEASYLIFMLRPYHTNFSKRLVKTPKLFFYDSGLVCWLLSIKNQHQLDLHPMKGNIFESFIISELLKTRFNNLEDDNLYFWRDRSGNEIDLIIDHGLSQTPVEIKSGRTFQSNSCKQIKKWDDISGSHNAPVVVYGGDESFTHSGCQVVTWRRTSDI